MRKQRGQGGVGWWVWRIGASASLGIAATLVIAYGGAVVNSEVDFGGQSGNFLYLRETNTWWDVVHAEGAMLDATAVSAVRAIRYWSNDLDPITGDVTAGIDPAFQPQAPPSEPCDVYLIGWPDRCMWGIESTADQQRVGLASVPEWLESVRFVHHPLPTRVWWPGMAANVGLFGGVWLLLLAGPGAVRRCVWRRKGGCPGCGYDVRGVDVCPECGMSVRKAAVEQARRSQN